MKKIIFTLFLLGTLSAQAQVPSYVPNNGIMCWYPFNNNANDESGNGNNGVVNGGATLGLDRFGNSSKAYTFDGINDFISVAHKSQLNLPGQGFSFSFSLWIKPNRTNAQELNIISKGAGNGMNSNDVYIMSVYNRNKVGLELSKFPTASWASSIDTVSFNKWNHLVVVYDITVNRSKFYINGVFAGQQSYSFTPSSNGDTSIFFIGKQGYSCNCNFFNGSIDDIGIWNRALTISEIKDLYNGCTAEISIEPNNQSSSINNQAQFNSQAKDTTASYQWQSNASNMGWSNVPSNAFYSGVSTKNLTVKNIQINNHKQLFRVIATKNTCKDTSIVAMLTVNDTCISSTTDTLYIKVNTSVSGNPIYNTIKVYPNPSSTHVVIDNGNYTSMGSYNAKIVNASGQQVFQSAINQQQFVIDVKTLGGAGVYTLYITDANNKVVGVKKIVLQ